MWYLRFRQAIGWAVAAHLVFSATIAAVAQSSADFESAISLAKGFATGGRPKDAVTEAQKAIRMNPSRFEGYYYAAIALLRQELPADADKYAQDALRLAPQDRRKEVEQLVSTIKQQLLALQKEEQADEARTAGRIFLAATLYLEAFELNPLRADLGLSARACGSAARAGPGGTDHRRLAIGADAAAKAEAMRQLSNLASALADEWSTNTTNGWRHLDSAFSVRPPAQSILEIAVEASSAPSTLSGCGRACRHIHRSADSPYIGLAAAHAAQGNRRSFETALSRARRTACAPTRRRSSQPIRGRVPSDAAATTRSHRMCASRFRAVPPCHLRAAGRTRGQRRLRQESRVCGQADDGGGGSAGSRQAQPGAGEESDGAQARAQAQTPIVGILIAFFVNGESCGRCSVAQILLIVTLPVGAPASAQDLDAGKSGQRLFASNCAACHRTPRGLAHTQHPHSTSIFLRQPSTASQTSAADVTAYLLAVGGEPARAKQKSTARRNKR